MRDTTGGIVLLALCVILLHNGQVSGQTYENATALKTAMLNGYDTIVRPKNNQTETLSVSMRLDLYSIKSVDIVNGIIYSVLGFSTNWTDERITWTPADYGGLSSVKIPQDSAWTPKIGLANGLEIDIIGESWMTVQYGYAGNAAWTPASEFESACTFNVEYWPFDKQICYFQFIVFNQAASEVTLHVLMDGIELSYYTPNSEWIIEDTYALERQYTFLSTVSYGIHFRRQSAFYALTIVLPLMALNIMLCLVFLMPTESGDRIGYTVTLLLAIVVYLILIGDHVPSTSDPLPLLCTYIVIIVFLAIFCLLAISLNLNLYFREDDVPSSSWWRKLVRIVDRCVCKRGKRKSRSEASDKQQLTQRDEDANNGQASGKKSVLGNNRVGPFVEKSKTFLEDEGEEEDSLSWKEVSYAMDKVLFVFFLLATSLPSIVIPVYLSTASVYPDRPAMP